MSGLPSLRRELNLTQNEMGLLIGKTREQVKKLEKHRNLIHSDLSFLLQHVQSLLDQVCCEELPENPSPSFSIQELRTRFTTGLEACRTRRNELEKKRSEMEEAWAQTRIVAEVVSRFADTYKPKDAVHRQGLQYLHSILSQRLVLLGPAEQLSLARAIRSLNNEETLYEEFLKHPLFQS